MDSSDDASVHTTPSLRAAAHTNQPISGKTDVDAHFQLDDAPNTPEPSSAAESPPPFSSHNFPSRYFPAPSPQDPYRALVTECGESESLAAFAPCGPAPPFEEVASSASAATSSVVADTKAALPRDPKDKEGQKDLDDGEPPPPYTEGSSPLEGFTYVMAAAGGAASIITQVQQGGPAPINTNLGGTFSLTNALRCKLTDQKGRMRTSPSNCGRVSTHLAFESRTLILPAANVSHSLGTSS